MEFLDLDGVGEDVSQYLVALCRGNNPAVQVLATELPTAPRRVGATSEEQAASSPALSPSPQVTTADKDVEESPMPMDQTIPDIGQEEFAGPGTFLPDGEFISPACGGDLPRGDGGLFDALSGVQSLSLS